MSRTLYVLIVDCPDRDADVSHAVSELAEHLLVSAPGTRSITTEVIVPPTGLQPALRPRVVLEEVRRHEPPEGIGDASER